MHAALGRRCAGRNAYGVGMEALLRALAYTQRAENMGGDLQADYFASDGWPELGRRPAAALGCDESK